MRLVPRGSSLPSPLKTGLAELAAGEGGPVVQGSAKGWEEGQEPAPEQMAAA